jgi:VIT1/CCC1 family predicted Fe2+/Mn2+ transporter
MNVPTTTRKRVLDPIDRISEVLFGLIMVLTFTGSLSAAEAGRSEVRTMVTGALGCNMAWGLIDGIMYLMGCLSERAEGLRTLTTVKRATTTEEAERAIVQALPPVIGEVLMPADIERIRDELNRIPLPGRQARLIGEDWLGAAGVSALVFASTIPVVVPFMLLDDAIAALRMSNVIAIAMMFACGYAFGHLAGYRRWLTGGSMVLLGGALVALTIALGG